MRFLKHNSHIISRFELAALIGIFISVCLANLSAFGQECDVLREDVVRLHILANSDSEIDQAVKLQVRDRILKEVGSVFETPRTKADAKAVAEAQLPAIERIAAQTLAENGFDLPVKAEVCNMYFNTRSYGDISLPAGNYDAVRITIGAGAGHNWWCVMYPPICVPAAKAPDSPALDELKAVNGEPMFEPKLAVVELFESIKNKLSAKS